MSNLFRPSLFFICLTAIVTQNLSAQDETAPPPTNPPKKTIRDAFPPREVVATPHPSPTQTLYGHPSPPYPRYVGGWGSGWYAWAPSGGADGLGYRYQYHTHVPGIGLQYYKGPVARYYPGPQGVSPISGISHYGYGPLGW